MTIAWKLPEMTDPLGRHWRQPEGLRDRVGLYETHATISERDWRGLSRYDSSTPSGVYAGKAWRRGPYLCWFGPERVLRTDRDGSPVRGCSIGYLRALVQGPGTNITFRDGGVK